MDFIHIFLMFIFYSFVGFIGEMIVSFIKYKRIIKRGFLFGPYLPVYGFGFLIVYFLSFFTSNYILIIIVCFFLFSLLEYLTSYLMEIIFNARWWDYSKEKYNINGRICLKKSIQFAISGLIIFILNPYLLFIVSNIYHELAYFIIIIFILDIFISTKILLKIKISRKNIDNTEEIKKKSKKELFEK